MDLHFKLNKHSVIGIELLLFTNNTTLFIIYITLFQKLFYLELFKNRLVANPLFIRSFFMIKSPSYLKCFLEWKDNYMNNG